MLCKFFLFKHCKETENALSEHEFRFSIIAIINKYDDFNWKMYATKNQISIYRPQAVVTILYDIKDKIQN